MKTQLTETLYNGKKVKEYDKVYFINSDGERIEGVIEKREFDVKLESPHLDSFRKNQPVQLKTLKKGTLFFHNVGFPIQDYIGLDVI
jgi:hypothetical protein